MSYTITNNVMYVRDDAGNLVPVSMIASGADQTIQAIKDAATAVESQIDAKVADANAAIVAKTDEQAARIPEVTALAGDVSGLKGDLLYIIDAEGIKYTDGKWYNTSASTVNISEPNSSPTWSTAVIPCVEYDTFTVTGVGGSSPRSWAFIDANGVVLSVSIESKTEQDTEIIAPRNSAYCILNAITEFAHRAIKGKRIRNLYPRDGYGVKPTTKNIVYVGASGADYTTVKSACDAVSGIASYFNQFEIAVLPGTYHENNITLPQYVHLHGIVPNSVVITSENAGTPTESVIHQLGNSRISNITIISHSKYCIHLDLEMAGTYAKIENVVCIKAAQGDDSVSNSVIGMGCFGGGTVYDFSGCTFINNFPGPGIGCHTSGTNDRGDNTKIIFSGCKFCKGVRLELNTHSACDSHVLCEVNNCTFYPDGAYAVNFNTPDGVQNYWQLIGANNRNFAPSTFALIDAINTDDKQIVMTTASVGQWINADGELCGIDDAYGVVCGSPVYGNYKPVWVGSYAPCTAQNGRYTIVNGVLTSDTQGSIIVRDGYIKR